MIDGAGQAVEHLLGIRVRHRPAQRLAEQVHKDHLRLRSLGHIVAFVLVVGVEGHEVGGDRHEAVMPRLRQSIVGVVGAAADMHVRALDAAAHHAGGDQQVHIAAVQPERLTDPQPRTRQQRDQRTATRLEAALQQTQSSLIRAQAEDALARAAEIWTRNTETPPTTLTHARALLLTSTTSPRPEPTPENANFDLLLPQGPRADAARGLGQLAHIPAQYGPEVAQALLALAEDPVGAIRHTVARLTPLVAVSDTDTAWEILERLAAQDCDDAVLAAAVTTACFRMSDRQRGASVLTTVMGRATPHPGRETAASACATAAGLLWVHQAMPEAGTALTSMITSWLDDGTWADCLHQLRDSGALTHDNDTVRQRALTLMQQLTEPALDRTRHALAQQQAFTDAEREQLKNTVRLLDNVASQIYFASGGGPNSTPPTEPEVRLVDEASH